LIIPHVADQFFWGQRIHERGVGLPPIRRTTLNGEGLTAALQELAHNNELRAAASLLGAKICAESGVDNAVRLIEQVFSLYSKNLIQHSLV